MNVTMKTYIWLLCFFGAAHCFGAINIIVREIDNNVVFSYEGALDLSGMNAVGPIRTAGILVPNNGQMTLTGATAEFLDSYENVVSPWGAFGTGGISPKAGLLSGAPFEVFGPSDFFTPTIGLPRNYVSGSTITGSSTFVNANYDTLGLTVGTYVTTLPNDVITMQIIPEPASCAVLLSLCSIISMSRRRGLKVSLSR